MPSFTAVTDNRYYYPAYAIVSRRGAIKSRVFWLKREAEAALRSGAYRSSDRVVRVHVTLYRGEQ